MLILEDWNLDLDYTISSTLHLGEATIKIKQVLEGTVARRSSELATSIFMAMVNCEH